MAAAAAADAHAIATAAAAAAAAAPAADGPAQAAAAAAATAPRRAESLRHLRRIASRERSPRRDGTKTRVGVMVHKMIAPANESKDEQMAALEQPGTDS